MKARKAPARKAKTAKKATKKKAPRRSSRPPPKRSPRRKRPRKSPRRRRRPKPAPKQKIIGEGDYEAKPQLPQGPGGLCEEEPFQDPRNGQGGPRWPWKVPKAPPSRPPRPRPQATPRPAARNSEWRECTGPPAATPWRVLHVGSVYSPDLSVRRHKLQRHAVHAVALAGGLGAVGKDMPPGDPGIWAQCTSVRAMPWLVSVLVSTAPGRGA